MDTSLTILPVFAVALTGYALAWLGIIRPGDTAGLSRYVFVFALPVMLFQSMAQVALPEQLLWRHLLAYYLPTLLIFAVIVVIGRRVFGRSRRESGLLAMGASFSNTVLIGIPVVSAAWGEEALLPLLTIVAIHAASLFTVTSIVVESGGEDRPGPIPILRRTAVGMLRNPLIVGIILGLAVNLLGLRLPPPLARTTGLIRGSAVPVALFVAGASLREYRVAGRVSEALLLTVTKLVVHPVLVWLMAVPVLRLDPSWAAVAVLTAALPVGINVTVFARRYDAAVAPVVSATLLSTLLAMASLSVLLAQLRDWLL